MNKRRTMAIAAAVLATSATWAGSSGETMQTSTATARAAFAQRLDLRFPCAQSRCAAWLYRPAGVARPPVVVMAHGLGGTRNLFLPPIAERFAKRGLAVFVFDYRRLGDSEGEPRQLIDIQDQLADWRAALAYVRSLPDVNGTRVALWGTSFSGGHVLIMAAQDPAVRAAVAQVPFVDGRAGERVGFWRALRLLAAALSDDARRMFGLSPHYLPIIGPGPPAPFAIIESAHAYRQWYAFMPADAGWRNELAAGVLLSIRRHRPLLRAPEVRCPLLLVAARDDEVIPFESIQAAAAAAPRAVLHGFDGGHFAAYGGPLFEDLIKLEADFLVEHLAAPATGS